MLKNKSVFSIVIPNHNTKQLLKNCLDSIYKTERNIFFLEIIVVDNASYDGSSQMVRKDFPKVKIIINNENLGFAKAVNQGWKASTGKIILFLNSDIVIRSKNTFSDIKDYIEKSPRVGAVSGKITLRSGKVDIDTHRGFPSPWSSLTYFFGFEKLFPGSKIFGQYHQDWKNLEKIQEIDAGCGAFLAVRRKILEKIDGWDEQYFFYGEDLDLCYRIKNSGWKIIFYPYIDVLHYKGASSGLRQETKDIAKNNKENLIKVAGASIEAWKIFYTKFYKNKYPRFVTGLVLFGIYLKGFLRILRFKLIKV